MSAERVPRQPAALRLVGSEGGSGGDDAIAAWLASFVGVLRMPAKEAESIREELESHLRERVRDLELAGADEHDAVRCALSELGDASHVAQRYREARAFPRRRLLMNLSMFAMAGAALVVGVATLSRPGGDELRLSVFSPPQPTAEAQAALSRRMKAEFQDAPIADVFSFVSQTIGMPINVSWVSIPQIGPDFRVSLVERNADFQAIFDQVALDIGSGTDWTLDYRISDGAIRIATVEYFDRQELALVSYDVSAFADAVPAEQFIELIQHFVGPEGWVDNGGSIAKATVAGSRMFVQAPKRYHTKIEWFINELSKEPGHARGPDPTARTRLDLAQTREAEARLDQARADKAQQDAAIAADMARRNEDVKRSMDAMAAQNAALQADRDALEKFRRDHQEALAIASVREQEMNRFLEASKAQNLDLERRLVGVQDQAHESQRLADAARTARESDAKVMQARIDDLMSRVNALTRQLEDAQKTKTDPAKP